MSTRLSCPALLRHAFRVELRSGLPAPNPRHGCRCRSATRCAGSCPCSLFRSHSVWCCLRRLFVHFPAWPFLDRDPLHEADRGKSRRRCRRSPRPKHDSSLPWAARARPHRPRNRKFASSTCAGSASPPHAPMGANIRHNKRCPALHTRWHAFLSHWNSNNIRNSICMLSQTAAVRCAQPPVPHDPWAMQRAASMGAMPGHLPSCEALAGMRVSMVANMPLPPPPSANASALFPPMQTGVTPESRRTCTSRWRQLPRRFQRPSLLPKHQLAPNATASWPCGQGLHCVCTGTWTA